MKCFIASAFGHADVDAIYDKAIRPILAELDIYHPTRVDRVEHNDDIDKKIFRSIDESDLCVADLTYARPSVYYEAGYAFGQGKPVIYLARQDHFKNLPSDIAGNLRVHFDLQMKNIISWTAPNKAFKTRLRSRLKHVLKPLFIGQKLAQDGRKEEESFASLSQAQRLALLVHKATFLMQARGYSLHVPDAGRQPWGFEKLLLGFRKLCTIKARRYRSVSIIASLSANRKILGVAAYHLRPPRMMASKGLSSTEAYCIIVSQHLAQSTPLSAFFSEWMPISNKVYQRVQQPDPDEESALAHTSTVAVIDGVKSLQGFVDRFRPLIAKL